MSQDQMSECRSIGSNCYPSSQSRKVSIGIMVDSLARKPSGATKENWVAVSDAEKENFREVKNQGKVGRDGIDASEKKQTEIPNDASSPRVTTKSFHQRSSRIDNLLPVIQASSLPSVEGRQVKHSGANDATKVDSVQFVSKQILTSGTGDITQKSDGFAGKRKEAKDGSSMREEEFTFQNAPAGLVLDKAMGEDKTKDQKTESLRLKLWEILGTVSSPKSHLSNSQARDVGTNNFKPAQMLKCKDAVVVQTKPLSDTIETDSENPDCTMKRPVTRSHTRKRTSIKKPSKKTMAGPSAFGRQRLQEKNFPNEEGVSVKGKIAANSRSSIPMQKKFQGKSSQINPNKNGFTKDINLNNVQEETRRVETSEPTAKMSLLVDDKKMGRLTGCPTGNEKDSTKLSSGGNSRQSPETPRTDKPLLHRSPSIRDSQEQPEDTDHFPSPTMKINSPILSSLPFITPKTRQINQNVCAPEQVEQELMTGNVCRFRKLQKSKANNFAANVQGDSEDEAAPPEKNFPARPSYFQKQKDVDIGLSESSSDDGEPHSSKEGSLINEDDLPTKPSFCKKQKVAEISLSESSDKDEDFNSSRECSPIIDACGEMDTSSPEAAAAVGSKFVHSANKRFCKQRGNTIDEFSPPIPSPKGTAESDWIPEPSGEIQEGDLRRVVALFALALQNFKNKMISATKKKASDILMSVYEEIHEELQNIESQIQTDLGKLTSLSRSKRKCLEGRFQEQQEQLKLMHDKFKTDIHQHLQDCKRTLEGLKVQQAELKGAVNNQKASHQKLLMQAEEAIEKKLSDAQRRITGVQKSAREKMLQLQHVLADCLNEGILS